MPDNDDQDMRALLVFYQEAGADALLLESPVNRLTGATPATVAPSQAMAEPSSDAPGRAITQPVRGAPPRSFALKPPVVPPPSPEAAAMAARAAAKAATSLDELRSILDRFEGCALRATATRLVFGDGNPQSRVMFVGEAPGRDEDIAGLPFVGRSGKLLDRMMGAIGLDRTNAYIANIIPWRPPGNRTPTPQESAICLPFILRQIELANPDILVCLGNPST